MELTWRYTDFTELNVSVLNVFVEKIVVHERDNKGRIELTQKFEIHLNFIMLIFASVNGNGSIHARRRRRTA